MTSTGIDKAWFFDLMKQSGVSLREVAGRMSLDPSALSRALDSKRKLKPTEIRQLAEILGRSTTEVFEHVSTTRGAPQGFGEMKQATIKQDEKQPVAKTKHHPAYGAMKGMITLLPGVDLTEPSYPDWKVLYGEDK